MAPPPPSTAPAGHLADGTTVALTFDGDKIASATPGNGTAWLWPPIVDSHVHLALYPVADQLAAKGVEVAIDLAAPEPTLGAVIPDSLRPPALAASPGSLIHVLAAGPMLTVELGTIAPGGEATLLVLDGDPRQDAKRLLSPREVWLRGHLAR